MFLLNSCLDLFSAPPSLEDPLSRSYGVSLPSSLATNLSTPQYVLPDYLCRFAVRVGLVFNDSSFSREYVYQLYHFSRSLRVLSDFSRRRVLDYASYTYVFQPSIPSDGGCVTPLSLRLHGLST